MTGISTATLRSWERRYGVPNPVRTRTAYRLYSDDDVALLTRMRDLCGQGMSPAEASKMVTASRVDPPATVDGSDPYLQQQGRLVAAAQAFDADGIEHALRRAALLASTEMVLERILVPALRQVGALWSCGELGVAHEHLLSEAITRFVRGALHMIQPASPAPRVLLACLEDEQHSLPLYLVAYRLALWGHHVVLLGRRTPADAVAQAVRALKPQLVGLSATIAPEASRAPELARAYGAAVGRTPWIVGGAGAAGLRCAVEQLGGVVADPDAGRLRETVRHALERSRSRPRPAGQR